MLDFPQTKQLKLLKEIKRENIRLKRILSDEMPVGDGSVFYRIVEQ